MSKGFKITLALGSIVLVGHLINSAHQQATLTRHVTLTNQTNISQPAMLNLDAKLSAFAFATIQQITAEWGRNPASQGNINPDVVIANLSPYAGTFFVDQFVHDILRIMQGVDRLQLNKISTMSMIQSEMLKLDVYLSDRRTKVHIPSSVTPGILLSAVETGASENLTH